jgi:hypothetical protein
MPSHHDDRPDQQRDVLTRDREQVSEPRRPERVTGAARETVVAPQHDAVGDGLTVAPGDVQRGARAAADAVDQTPGAGPRADDHDRAGAQHLVHALPRKPRALVEPVRRRPVRRAQVTVDVEDRARLERARDTQQDIGALEACDGALIPLAARDRTGDQCAAVDLPIDLRGERILRQRVQVRERRNDAEHEHERGARDADRAVQSQANGDHRRDQRDACDSPDPGLQRRGQREPDGKGGRHRCRDDLTARLVHGAPRAARGRYPRPRPDRRPCETRRARCARRRCAPRATVRCRRARRAARPSPS